jgi:thioredoxin reductase (NADPH)
VRESRGHRGSVMHQNVKYWIKPDIENRIKNGEIAAHFDTTVMEITPTTWCCRHPGELTLKNDFVLALTGYHPDLDFLRKIGVLIGDPPDCRPTSIPIRWKRTYPVSTSRG